MSLLDRLKIRTKIFAGFAVAVVVAVAMGAMSHRTGEVVRREVGILSDQRFVSYRSVSMLALAHLDAQGQANALLHLHAPADVRKQTQDALAAALKEVAESRENFGRNSHDEAEQQTWNDLGPRLDLWRARVEKLAAAVGARDELVAGGHALDSLEVKEADASVWDAWLESRDAARLPHRKLEELMSGAAQGMMATQMEIEEGLTRADEVQLATAGAGALLLALVASIMTRGLGAQIAAAVALARRLAEAVREGRLGERGEESEVALEFRPMVAGLNATMDAFTAPLRRNAEYMDRISRGDVPPPIAEACQGEFETTNESLNRCIAALARLVSDTNTLAHAAVEGRLAVRADPAAHQGEFRRIVEELNRTLDTVVAPLEEATGALERLAGRDLRVRIDSAHPGDYAKLKLAFNATAEALHAAMVQAAGAAEQVSAAAGQIASASQSVANGASEQASALEETSASLESMTSMTKQSADNAQQASGLAGAARVAASEGAAAMEQMVGAMGKIRASADSTSQIIRDINEIAFQTNLLALNAAVEAARAGDAGRGFAVVAEEVRALALRSKEAAQKTEGLIRESVRQSEQGVQTAGGVQGRLTGIATSVAKVSDIVAEIAASAREQAAGIDQVTRAVSEMDRVTQQNAANSEQSSSAASELSGQAAELAEIVGAFQLDRDDVRAHPAAELEPFVSPASNPARSRAGRDGGAAVAFRGF